MVAGAMLFATLPVPSALADVAPAARAARLTSTEGYVHVDYADGTPGDPAQLNMPLLEGQIVVTGENGQAEVEFEDGSVARLTPNSTMKLAHMTVDASGSYTTQMGLVKGLAYFELRSAPHFAYTVDAGGDIVSPAENTTVRINLDEPPAAVAVLDGTARVERVNGYRIDVHAGETFRADKSEAGRYFLTQEIATDTWDQWNESRDQAAADAAPKQTAVRDGFAGNQGYGWSDLDANGSWYDVPGQGQVWQPAGGDDAAFDPYSNGSWVYYPVGGYVWASNYSWGWTPFRCGGWSYWNTFGWGWSPNSGCGGYGFAGYGGGGFGYGGGYGFGGGINIIRPPQRYPVHRPDGGKPGVHPIIRVAGGPGTTGGFRPGDTSQGPRRIGGVVATPLRPVGTSYTSRGGSAVGASLRRDFPMDRATHAPVMGVQPGRPGAVQAGFINSGTVNGNAPAVGSPQNASGRPADGAGQMRYGGQQGFRPPMQQGTQPGYQQGLRPVNPASTPGNFARPGGQQGYQQTMPRPIQQQNQQQWHPASGPPPTPAMHSSPPMPAMRSAPSAAPAAASHK